MALLEVKGLTVQLKTEDGMVHAVDGVSYSVERGKVLGIVGESGSGKSVSSLAVMGLLRGLPDAEISGQILLDGRDLLAASDEEMRRVRGNGIAMIFQDPLSSLHPFYKIGDQLIEAVRAHKRVSRAQALERTVEMLGLVGIPSPRRAVEAYPHEFSGGMRQRVMIAMALVNEPQLLIADEPTTALDVTVQAQILELLQRLQRELDTAIVMITHDLGVVAEVADEIAVMYAGRIVEQAPKETLFAAPEHPYTWGLLTSIPRLDLPRGDELTPIPGRPPSLIATPSGCSFHPRCPYVQESHRVIEPALEPVPGSAPGHQVACLLEPAARRALWSALQQGAGADRERESVRLRDQPRESPSPAGTVSVTTVERPLIEVRDLVRHFAGKRGSFSRRQRDAVRAVDGVSFDVMEGEALGLVGESGCGKSTTARLLTRLLEPTSGTISYRGQEVGRSSRRELAPVRRDMQMIFQDPYSSLNPRMTVGSVVGEPFIIHDVERNDAKRKLLVQGLMEQVGLNPEHYNRYPHEFSGGQRQRIGVARAIALKPKVIVADEPVAALDVSIQAQIINLLRELQRELGLTLVFIAHDLSVVRHVCDRVIVMYLGKVVESATAEQLFDHPTHPYTRALLSAVPVPDPQRAREKHREVLAGDLPSPIDPPAACRFHTRCSRFHAGHCDVVEPLLEAKPGGNVAACHYPLLDTAVKA